LKPELTACAKSINLSLHSKTRVSREAEIKSRAAL
jgi:hypothetical protein